MTFPRPFEPLVLAVLDANRAWEAEWPAVDADHDLLVDPETWRSAVEELSRRLRENYPHFHPLYAGQMLKPPHPAALVAYIAAMLVNPNNHALDGGRATAAMEKEALVELGGMFGIATDRLFGHLTSSGTIANLEALWVGRELRGDRPVVASSDAHYTHKRMCALLRLPFVEIPADGDGRLDLAALDSLLERQDVGTVVVTLGTTGLGAVDPLPEVLARRTRHGFRVHADAAYGGYYRLLEGRVPELAAFSETPAVDSIVVDPHKHGLQPYGCGCVLFTDPGVARVYAHSSPYTYFSSPEHHPGETTLECSRAGAAAAALWLTLRGLPLRTDGAMARSLARCASAARSLARGLPGVGYVVHVPPAMDIVTYFPRASSASGVSRASETVFAQAERSSAPLYLAKLTVDRARFSERHPDVEMDADRVTVLRSCLMRPEQEAWVPEILRRLAEFAPRRD